MQQHPVPQNITGFEFKLIGSLTLRQFGYVGGAGLLSFILYSAHLPFLVVLIIAGPIDLLALALAFFPYNDMPFERYMAAFIKTIYSPNVRVWHREPKTLGFLEPQFASYLHRQNQLDTPRVLSDRTKLNSYLAEHKLTRPKSLVDINEERRMQQLNFPPLVKDEKEIFIAPNLTNIASNFEQSAKIPSAHFKDNQEVVQSVIATTEGGEK